VTSQPPDLEPAQEQPDEGGGDESWKEEYEEHLSHWRAESAAAREKAQQERERWRLIREREREQEKEREREREREREQQVERESVRGMLVGGSQRKDSEWETVTNSSNIPESAPKHAERGGRGLSATEQAASAVQDTPPRYSTLLAGERDLATGEMPRGSVAGPIEVRGFHRIIPHIPSCGSPSLRCLHYC
jgi:chromosome segregation ATPase